MKLMVKFPAGTTADKVEEGMKALALAATAGGADVAVEMEAGLPGYMSVDAASEWSGIGADTLRKWLREKRLTGYKPGKGKVWLVKESELKAFIEKNKSRAERVKLAASPFEKRSA